MTMCFPVEGQWRWKRYVVSLGSSVTSVMWRPNSCTSSTAIRRNTHTVYTTVLRPL